MRNKHKNKPTTDNTILNKRPRATRGSSQSSNDEDGPPRRRGRSQLRLGTIRESSAENTVDKVSEERQGASPEASQTSSDEDGMPRRRGRSQVRNRGRQNITTPAPLSPVPSTPTIEDPRSEDDDENDDDSLSDAEDGDEEASEQLTRIRTAIDYTRAQRRKRLHPNQTTRFSIPLPTEHYTPSATEATALRLLRASPALKVLESPHFVVYELGMPVPYLLPQGSGRRLIHTAQWWMGKTIAEVKAGPHAEPRDAKRAIAHLKGQATKKLKKVNKTAKQRDIDHKLEEGLRRQEGGSRCTTMMRLESWTCRILIPGGALDVPVVIVCIKYESCVASKHLFWTLTYLIVEPEAIRKIEKLLDSRPKDFV